jgi:LuxR family transcriptional regulator, maltose regulon positive regulatory protein
MARTNPPPLVDHTHLLQPEHAAEPIAVGAPAWYSWLEDATSFVFRSPHGPFTAYKERRGPTQEYWKAYRRRAGRLQRVYLGKSGELTLDRLNAAAAELANKPSADAPSSDAAVLETTPASADLAEDVVKAELDPGAQEDSFRLSESSSLHATSAFAAPDDAQSLHLLSTKLAIPTSRATLVPRPRLAAQIDTAITQQQKLILIAAPAGFGKTTTIAAWLGSRTEGRVLRTEASTTSLSPQSSVLSTRVAWLALDDTDNHLGQFLAYLIAAFETVRPKLGADAWALLRAQAAQPPTHAILASLVNALAAPADQIMLVLDDYHTITLQAIHEAITFLLDRMPAQMQIVITTRADPPLPLARLRARGQLTELRAADLRFTGGEAAYLFDNIHGIALAPDALAALEARTEGWATGLQLAALSLRQQDVADLPTYLADFTGSHIYVFDYLADEVFQQQPEPVRSFLLQTAILGRMCGPLCAAVTGQNAAQTLLEDLDQANMFLIRLDSNRRWYRYHHLFRDFLHEQLDRAVEAADRAQLYRRASAWFEQQGGLGEAIDYALQAEDWGDALRCMTPLMASQRFYEYYLDWPRWLAALPDAALVVEPDCCRRLAWILIFTGHLEAAERPLALAETAWRSAGNQTKVGELLGLRAIAWGWKGDFPRAIQAAQQALALLPADAVDRQGVPAYVLGASDLQLGHIGAATDWLNAAAVVMQRESVGAQHPSEIFLSLATAASLARAYQLRGDLQHAAALYRDVIKRMGSTTYLQVPSALIYFGSLCYEWNDLAEAERLLREGIAVADRIGRGRYWPGAWRKLAQVLWASGDALQAQALAEQALMLARALDNQPDIAKANALQRWLWLAKGDLAAALHWLHTHAVSIDLPLSYPHQTEYLMHARIRIAQAQQAPESVDLRAVMHQLNQLLQLADADQRMADRITIHALLALAHAVAGDSTQPWQLLAAAIRLGAPEGYIRTFVDEGAPMRALLQALRGKLPTIAPDEQLLAYMDRLLSSFPTEVSASASPTPTPTRLSEREYAVLQLLAEGQSIAEIAATLVISAHTARTHVKNIYIKLDAHNRVQALDRARGLKLL